MSKIGLRADNQGKVNGLILNKGWILNPERFKVGYLIPGKN